MYMYNNIIIVLDAYCECSFNIFIQVLYNIFKYTIHILDQIKYNVPTLI